jgi:catechol 2,3-dioxygenase-like lactoylglutathione lyase family enzyme
MTASGIQPAWIAKDCLDIGLFTNRLDEMLAFWQEEVGLAYDHMLPLGGGVRQHRHDFETAVLKLNHARMPLAPESPGGYQRLIIGKQDIAETKDLYDPDGNAIRLVPKGHEGVEHWAIELAVASSEAFFNHYETRLGLPRDPVRSDAVRCGRSLIIGTVAPDIADLTDPDEMMRTGFRYTTIQVHKVDPVHSQAVSLGADEGAPPETLGQTARISFLKDANGNWMELSQRASITGSLDV